MLPWFKNGNFPLYLAPMAGVTDRVFRSICKKLGADVMVTEFVSSEGIIRRDDRTRKYTEFDDEQRPVGVQLFGADGKKMAEAAKKIIDWKEPDFIDINFGCPVNKVVVKNGGSALLRDCPVLAKVASEVVQGVGSQVPVTGKIRIGWDFESINAVEVSTILEDSGMQAVSIHGRTRSQSYGGEADWNIIDECARSVSIPIIGNGDITSGKDVEEKKEKTAVSGIMIGRAAMQNPWIFRDAKHYLKTGEQLEPASLEERWKLINEHCQKALEWGRYGNEKQTLMAMRSRLMAYSKGLPSGKRLRQRICKIVSMQEINQLAEEHMNYHNENKSIPETLNVA
ncbi:MAG: tRNA dihydrouridine synthase DusB [Verrucomicrobiales bacterium]